MSAQASRSPEEHASNQAPEGCFSRGVTAATAGALILMGQALLRLSHCEPARRKCARNRQVPPLAAREEPTDEAHCAAGGQAGDEEDGTAH